jgi:hypothetical protein
MIEDEDAPDEFRKERYFDPSYFVTMLLMELSGGRFRFDRSKYKGYFFLAFAGPGKEGNHYLRRTILNAPPGVDVRQIRQTADGHYDYRKNTLRRIAKRIVKITGQKTRARGRGREDAVAFAVELFKRQAAANDSALLPALDLSEPEYESLLRKSLLLADAMGEKVRN